MAWGHLCLQDDLLKSSTHIYFTVDPEMFPSSTHHIRVTSVAKGEGCGNHSSVLAWKIPWIEEPGRLQSMGSLGVRHD